MGWFSRPPRRRVSSIGAASALTKPDHWPSDARIKHLEFIQAVISRLATTSFIAKGWALTVAGAVYGFAASHLSPFIAAVGLLPTLGFWWLDAYFLRQERLFRCLYDDVRQPDTPVVLFSMHTRLYTSNPLSRWPKVIFSITLVTFYGTLLAAGLGVLAYNINHEVSRPHSSRTSSAVSSRSALNNSGLGGHMSPIGSPCQRGTR